MWEVNTGKKISIVTDMKRKAREKDISHCDKSRRAVTINVVIKKSGKKRIINGIKLIPVNLYINGERVHGVKVKGKTNFFWDELRQQMYMTIKPPRKPPKKRRQKNNRK